jgi:PAS domain S-box-containing protein
MKPGWSIRTQLFLLTATVALPLIALLAYNLYCEFAYGREQAVSATTRLTQTASVDAAREVSDAKISLATLAHRPRVRALDAQACDPLFEDFHGLRPGFSNLITVNLAGNIVCSALAAAPGRTTVPQDGWLRELTRSGKFTIGKPATGAVSGKPVVVLAHPLHDAAGKLIGAVALGIDLAAFRPINTRTVLPPGTTTRIIDRDGVVIAGSNLADPSMPDRWTGKSVRGTPIVDVVLARKQGIARAAGSDGVERQYAFQPIPGTEWYVYAGIPVSVALAGPYANLRENVLIGTLILLLALPLVMWAARATARPVRAMAATAQELTRGNRSARFQAGGAAEIAAVASQFNLALDAMARAEHLQAASERRLGEIIAAVAEGVISVDERLRIVLFNPAAEQMFGRSSGEMIGRALGILVPERFRAQHDEHVRRFAATGQTSRAMGQYGLIHGLRASGEEFPVEATVSQSGTSPDKLLTVILRDVTERLRAEVALRAYSERLRRLSHALFDTEERERRILARELHDRIGQNVTILNLNLSMLRSELPTEFLRQAAPRLDECEALLHYTGQLVRDLMSDLRPPGLDELGLLAALHEHARQVTKRSGLSVTVRGTEVQPRPPASTEITLFRIAQEALVNVIAHARATEIVVTVDSDPDRVVLTVADNGCGFDAAAVPPAGHLGVLGMRERAEAIGGRLQVESAPGAGTRVIVEAPRAAPADQA